MKQKKPIISSVLLGLIILGCIGCRFIMTKDPTYMDLANYSHAPNGEFLFGTDTMGRDIFSMIWYGGRISRDGDFNGDRNCVRRSQWLCTEMAG